MSDRPDTRDPETIKQMNVTPTFPPKQRQVPLKQSDFRHQHEWQGREAGGKVCKTCGTVVV